MGTSGASDHGSCRQRVSLRTIAWLAGALAIWATSARAQPDCEAALQAELARLRGPEAVARSARYRVTFSRDGELLRASISRDGSNTNRALSARGPSCTTLAGATAVALALLLDSEPPTPAEEPTVPVPVPAPLSPPTPTQATVSVGGALLLGVPRDTVPALSAGLGLRHGALRAELGVSWGLPARESFGPGTIRSQLIAGSLRACWRAPIGIALCTGAYLGALAMQPRGYTRNDDAHPWWGAAPLELAWDYVSGPVGVELGAGALFPFRRQEFSIEGVGSAERDWPVQALFSLRLFALAKM